MVALCSHCRGRSPVPGLNKLTESFLKAKRISFMDTHSITIGFPYASYNKDADGSKPDVSATLPGEVFEDRLKLTWNHVSLVFVIIPEEDQDPLSPTRQFLGCPDKDTLRQLVINAPNLMAAHLSLFTFVIGIYDPSARIYRFDRASCIASPLFSYRDEPEILRTFLALRQPSSRDPTVKLATDEDLDWADETLQNKTGKGLSSEDRATSRWLAVYCLDNGQWCPEAVSNGQVAVLESSLVLKIDNRLGHNRRGFRFWKQKYLDPDRLEGLLESVIEGDLSQWEPRPDDGTVRFFKFRSTKDMVAAMRSTIR
ncbi:hypothetical protein CERSUDRAFT_127261, partial [Gelatoporia subvermispora B]